MKATDAKTLTEKTRSGSRLFTILKNIEKRCLQGTYNEVDYICKEDIEELRKLGYNVEVHNETSLSDGHGDSMCTITWYE